MSIFCRYLRTPVSCLGEIGERKLEQMRLTVVDADRQKRRFAVQNHPAGEIDRADRAENREFRADPTLLKRPIEKCERIEVG